MWWSNSIPFCCPSWFEWYCWLYAWRTTGRFSVWFSKKYQNKKSSPKLNKMEIFCTNIWIKLSRWRFLCHFVMWNKWKMVIEAVQLSFHAVGVMELVYKLYNKSLCDVLNCTTLSPKLDWFNSFWNAKTQFSYRIIIVRVKHCHSSLLFTTPTHCWTSSCWWIFL